MNRVRSTAVAFVSCLALGGVAVAGQSAAFAAEGDEPCAKQQTQVDKAQAALDRAAANFAAHPTTKNGKEKKAQKQRLAKATERLEECLAEPTEEPAE